MRMRSDRTSGWLQLVAGTAVVALVASGCAIARVSVSSTGTEGDQSSSTALGVTDNGRYVLFSSDADNLVPGDENEATDIFRHDTETGATVRVNVSTNGGELPFGVSYAAMSSDGRYVVFPTPVPGDPADTNDYSDAYVRDLVDHTTTWASQPPPEGLPAAGGVGSPEISTGGRFVSFRFSSLNPASGEKLLRRDRELGKTVSLTPFSQIDGFQASRDAHHYAIDDGCFPSGPCYPTPYVVDADNSAAGWPELQFARCAFDEISALSPDGRYLVYHAGAIFGSGPPSNCLPRGSYLVDRANGLPVALELPTDAPGVVAVSRNARAVLYFGDGALFPGGTAGRRHLYLRDLVNGTDTRPDISLSGQEADADILNAVLSDDGTYVAFATAATNLVPDDHNGVGDVFVRKTGMPPSP